MGAKRSREKVEELDRRAGVLANKVPATARSIAHAFVLKDGDVFFVAAQSGALPEKGPHGFGLYHHDCRFLSGYVLELDGRAPMLLGSTSAPGYKGVFELTNPVLPRHDGGRLDKHELAVRWDRVVEGERRALHDVIHFKSYAMKPADVEVSLWFRAGFEDVFAVRGLTRAHPGRQAPPAWAEDTLRFSYEGADGKRRITCVRFWRHPDYVEETRARFLLHLDPEAEETISLSVLLSEEPADAARHGAAAPGAAHEAPPDFARVTAQQDTAEKATTAGLCDVRTSREQLDRTIDRSRRDLAMLRSSLGDITYYAAGVPWFVALFGRDAITVALESLAFDPDIAVGTLRLLAAHQAKKDDASRDEEPGKILHELRVASSPTPARSRTRPTTAPSTRPRSSSSSSRPTPPGRGGWTCSTSSARTWTPRSAGLPTTARARRAASSSTDRARRAGSPTRAGRTRATPS